MVLATSSSIPFSLTRNKGITLKRPRPLEAAKTHNIPIIQKSLRRNTCENWPLFLSESGGLKKKWNKIPTTKQATLKMRKRLLHSKKRRVTLAISEIDRILKDAAVSWNPRTLPQLSRPKTAVIKGRMLGRYIPAPSPRNREVTANEVYDVAYIRCC